LSKFTPFPVVVDIVVGGVVVEALVLANVVEIVVSKNKIFFYQLKIYMKKRNQKRHYFSNLS